MLSVRDLIPWRSEKEVGRGDRDPFHPLMTLHRDIDHLFEDMWRGFGRLEPLSGGLSPSVDISEDEKEIRITAELPGMDEKDVEVVLKDNRLTIKGEKKEEKKVEEKGRAYSERSYGAFERSIPIDCEVVSDKINAEFKNGVLTVNLPKSEEASRHFVRIPIKTSGKH